MSEAKKETFNELFGNENRDKLNYSCNLGYTTSSTWDSRNTTGSGSTGVQRMEGGGTTSGSSIQPIRTNPAGLTFTERLYAVLDESDPLHEEAPLTDDEKRQIAELVNTFGN